MTDIEGDPHQTNAAPSRVRHGVLAALCAAAAIAYLSRNCIGVAEEAIRRDLSLSTVQMGWVMAAFYWAYAGFQLPGGWLGHVWGSRRALPILAIAWSAATAAAAPAVGFLSLLAGRVASGAAQAGLFPCSVDSLSHWFPLGGRALACGLLASFMSVGGAVAVALTGWLLDAGMNWRLIFVVFSVPGAVWAAWFFLCFRDRPELHAAVNPAELAIIRESAEPPLEKASDAESTPWLALLTSRSLWLICGQQFFRAAGYIFYASWFPTFLKETRGVSTAEAGYLTSLPLLAVVVGSPLGGVLVDWVWRRTNSRRLSRQGVAVPSMAGCAALIFAAYFTDDAVTAVMLITAGSFCAALAGPCAYTITIDMGGRHVSTVFATMNMTGNIGAALCPVVVAKFVKLTGDKWEPVLLFFAAVYLAAALCWAGLNPRGTVFDAADAARETDR